MDKYLEEALRLERKRQEENIELIASENYVSKAVLALQGSILTNKYAEGYSGKRYYGGCEYIDMFETKAIEYLKELFGCKFANVQPHSGSSANMAVYRALLNHGDKVMGMNLNHGGHLTHGYKLNFSGIDYEIVSYDLDPKTEMIDYDKLRELAIKTKPKMIIAGASAYSRIIDFKKIREICDEVGAYMFVDMAHIAGLVAVGLHPSPIPYADVVTSTTHKTLRGPRGGIILTNNEEIAKKIDKAQSFYEALQPEYKNYMEQVVKNIKAMSDEFIKMGYHVISGGTDNHLILVDVLGSVGITGKDAEILLDKIHITVNKNTIPNETEKATVASGIRIGSPAMTTRGFKEDDFIKVAHIIDEALKNRDNEEVLDNLTKEVLELTSKHPLDY